MIQLGKHEIHLILQSLGHCIDVYAQLLDEQEESGLKRLCAMQIESAEALRHKLGPLMENNDKRIEIKR